MYRWKSDGFLPEGLKNDLLAFQSKIRLSLSAPYSPASLQIVFILGKDGGAAAAVRGWSSLYASQPMCE